MDDDRARTLLEQERIRVEALIAGVGADRENDRMASDHAGDWSDSAQPMTAEGNDDAVAAGFEERMEAIHRAEERVVAGTYGRSVRSGAVIPDERLEADPAAELTVTEADEQ